MGIMKFKSAFLARKSQANADDEETRQHKDDKTGKDVEKAGDSKEADGQNGETEYPGLKVVLPVMLSLYLTVFLCAIDRTIIGVAIPAISNEFRKFEDISWYEAAFLLGFATLQLPSGKLYTFLPAKWLFMGLVAIFEIGSIICAAAPSSAAFILGRLITGIGASGILGGSMVIGVDLLPLADRPKWLGSIGASFALASILGPLLGGVFTTKVTWRWCFWINVPIGGLALGILFFILPRAPPPVRATESTLRQKIAKFDPIGTFLLIPGLVCLLFALQWGGSHYAWDTVRIIVLLILGVLLLCGFILSQIWMKGNATVPPRIMCQRTIAASFFSSCGIGATLIITTFYLPIWFQAIKNLTAEAAGVRLLPYFLATVIFVITSGVLVSFVGYYTPFLNAGTAILVVGMGLLTTLSVNSGVGKLVGLQIIVGVGMGLSLQQPNIAAQTVLAREDIPIGVTVVTFGNFFASTLMITVCQTILSNRLASHLRQQLPGFDTRAIANTGATRIRDLVPPAQLPLVLDAYNSAIATVFICGLVLASFAFLASLLVEWRTVKKPR